MVDKRRKKGRYNNELEETKKEFLMATKFSYFYSFKHFYLFLHFTFNCLQ